MNNIPRKILVLMTAKISNALDSLTEKICVKTNTITTKTASASKEKTPIAVVIMKNHQKFRKMKIINLRLRLILQNVEK